MADLASLTLPIKDETTGVVTPTKYDIPTGGSSPIVAGTGDYSAVQNNAAGENTATGIAALALGYGTTASGRCAIAGGGSSAASGNYSLAFGAYSSTLGNPEATASNAIALGLGAKATANGAISLGQGNTASGGLSFAVGNRNRASGARAIAMGEQVVADSDYQTVLGKFNVADANGTYLIIIGNGTADNARANAVTVDMSGNLVLAGKATLGAAPVNNMDVATKQYVDTSAIPAPSSPTSGQFLVYDGSAWTAQTVPNASGVSF